MLHDDIQVVICHQVLDYANCTVVILILKQQSPLNLHHHALLKLGTPLFEVFKFLDEQLCLRKLVHCYVGLDRRQ